MVFSRLSTPFRAGVTLLSLLTHSPPFLIPLLKPTRLATPSILTPKRLFVKMLSDVHQCFPHNVESLLKICGKGGILRIVYT